MSTEPIDYRAEALRCLERAEERREFARKALADGNQKLANLMDTWADDWIESARVWRDLE